MLSKMKIKLVLRCAVLGILFITIFSENNKHLPVSQPEPDSLVQLKDLESRQGNNNDSEKYSLGSTADNPRIVTTGSENEKMELFRGKVATGSQLQMPNLSTNNDKFQSKLSWLGDVVIGSMLTALCMFYLYKSIHKFIPFNNKLSKHSLMKAGKLVPTK